MLLITDQSNKNTNNINNTNINPISSVETQQIDERTRKNIEILRQLKQNNFSDLSKIKQYSGFGGLRNMLKRKTVQAELLQFLSPEEIDCLFKSTRTGYFTPAILIDFIYHLVQRLGFKQGKILEPACGHGAFFERMPKVMREKSFITGIELEPLSARIAQAVYPDIRILNKGFHHFQEANFDLIIGNPPYAKFSVFDQKHPDLKKKLIHHYFVAKSVRLLKEGGLLVMVLPYYVLDKNEGYLRHKIAKVADLVTAYRLPDSLFDNAKIIVDVVIFQRTSHPKKDWIDTTFIELPNQDNRKERFYINQYFVDHPEQVIGQLSGYKTYSFSENRPRRGLRCTASLEEVQRQLANLLNNNSLPLFSS